MRLFLLALFSFSLFSVQAQVTADSVRHLLETDAPYAEKMKTLIGFSSNYAQMGRNKELLQLCAAGLELAREKNDSLSIGVLTRNRANALYFLGNYDSAARGYFASVAILEKSQWQSELAETLNNLGRLFRKTRDLDRALNYYDRAMAIYQRLNDRSGVAKILNESGVVFEYRNDFDEAIRRYEQSLKIDEELKDSVGISYALNFLAGVNTLKKDYRRAEEYMARVITLRRQMKDTFGLALAYTDLGATLYAKGDLLAAEGYLKESNRVATQMGYKELMMNNFNELANVAEAAGNYKNAYDYLQQKTALHDSIFTIEKTKQIEELNTRYETTVKENIIQQQKLRLARQQLYIGGAVALLLTGTLYGYSQYKRFRLKKEKQLQEAIFRQQEMAAKAVMAAEENERKRIASELHDGVGQMMSAARMNLSAFENDMPEENDTQRHALGRIMELVDDSAKEIRNVSHNLMPLSVKHSNLAQAVRDFTGKIDPGVLEISVFAEAGEEPEDAATANILYRVIQECVNNVLKHARATRMDITMAPEDDQLAITIEDNGQGFNPAELAEKDSGIGLGNIKSRISYLKGTVEFDSAPGRGTVVMIHIPFQNKKNT